jgi:hypothetical protein
MLPFHQDEYCTRKYQPRSNGASVQQADIPDAARRARDA